jgi:hypothetical protein
VTAIATAVYLGAAICALLYGAIRGLLGLLVATVFLMPWFGLMKDIGLTINADRIVAVFLLVALVFRNGPRALSVFTPFVLYFIVVTVALSVSLPDAVSEYAPTKGQWRWLFQLPIWVMVVAPGAALAVLGTKEAITKVFRTLILSATLLGAMGIAQVVVYYSFGVDLFPVGFDALDARHAAFDTDSFLGGSVFRASALAGEPKHLAYTLVISLTLIAIDRTLGGFLDLTRRGFVAAGTTCLVGLVLTFSTQGFALLGLNAAVLVLGSAILRGVSKRVALLLVTLPLLVLMVRVVPGLTEVIHQRAIGRLIESGVVEDWNEAVWAWYRVSPFAWPFGVGLGNVHLYAAPYVPREYLYYMQGNVFVAKAGVLRIASELGVVGLIIFGATVVYPLVPLWRRARRGSRLAAAAGACGVICVIDYLLSSDGPTYVFLFVGLAAAAARVTGSKLYVEEPRLNVPTSHIVPSG